MGKQIVGGGGGGGGQGTSNHLVSVIDCLTDFFLFMT